MRVVIDTNKIISALIKNSLSREVIINDYFEFITPDHTINEINKYREYIIKKSNINNKEFEVLMKILFSHIRIVQKENYRNYINEAKKLIKDLNDTPFIALALANNCAIWSDDEDYQKQEKIEIFKTKDIIKII